MVQQLPVGRVPIRLVELLAVLAFLAVLAVAIVSWPLRGGGRPPSGIEQIYIMNADGTGLRPVSLDPNVRHATPAWSPDGRYFVMSVGGGKDYSEPAHLWVLDLETAEMRQLTHGDGRDHGPAWSPDGSTIVFATHDLPIGSAPSRLYSIRPDGAGFRPLKDGQVNRPRRAGPQTAGISPLPRIGTALGCRSWPARNHQGEVIVKEGERGIAFYVIESGKAEVSVDQGYGVERLSVIGPGDFFGEMALFQNQVRSVTVTALEDTRLLILTRWDFLAEINRQGSGLAIALLAILARRVRTLELNIHKPEERQAEEDRR